MRERTNEVEVERDVKVTVSDGTNSLSYQLIGASNTAGIVTGAEVRYANAVPNVEVDETATNTGLKENLVLSGPPTGSLAFSSSFARSAGSPIR